MHAKVLPDHGLGDFGGNGAASPDDSFHDKSNHTTKHCSVSGVVDADSPYFHHKTQDWKHIDRSLAK